MDDRTQVVEVREHFFEDDGRIPNNPDLPLLIYPGMLGKPALSPSRCKELIAENGWGGAWIDGVFSYHHYHSNAHEALCVVSGEARIAFGGPGGTTVEVEAGDVAVIPAGVGHCKAGASSDFAVVGAYPRGQEAYDLRAGEEGERPEVLDNIRNVPLPEADPLFGSRGPLLDRWSR
jgi:uncharacterized protein YjlB